MSKMLKSFRNTFLSGLLVIAPIFVTVAITVWLFNKLTAIIPEMLKKWSPFLDELLDQSQIAELSIQMVGLLIIIAGIFLIGLIAKNVVGRKLLGTMENLLMRIPMISSVYSTIRQIGHAILNSSEAEGMFRKVILFEYPKKDCWALGFLTATGAEECKQKTGNDLLSVFVPTTPNPTSGFMLMLPRDTIIPLEMSVTEAMRLIISGGAIRPPFIVTQPPEKPALD